MDFVFIQMWGDECVINTCNMCCLWPLFQDHRFSDEIDKLTGYKTQSILCMAICNSDGEVIGVVQAINKNPMGTPFTEDDEKVRQLCLLWIMGFHITMLSIEHLQDYRGWFDPYRQFGDGAEIGFLWSIIYPLTSAH